eukprot:644906_1
MYTRLSPRNSGEYQDRLRIACLHNNVDTIRKLCKHHNVNIEIEDSHCTTPLMLACYYGCYEVVDELLTNQQALVDHGDIEDVKPLHYACEQQHIRIVELLLKNNADIHSQTKKGWTALHYATESSNFDLIKLLLLHGASKIIQDKYEQSPMDIATKNKIADIICLFQSNSNHEIRTLISNNSTSHHRSGTSTKPLAVELERERIMRGELRHLKSKIHSLQYEKDMDVELLTQRIDSIEGYVQTILKNTVISTTPDVSIKVPKPNERSSKTNSNEIDIHGIDITDTPMTELNSPYDDDDDDGLSLPDFDQEEQYDTEDQDEGKIDLVKMPSLQPEANSLEIGYSMEYDTNVSSNVTLPNIMDTEDDELDMSPIREDPTPLPKDFTPAFENKYVSSPLASQPYVFDGYSNPPYERQKRARSHDRHERSQTDNEALYKRYSNRRAQFHIDEYLKTNTVHVQSKSDPETHDNVQTHAYMELEKDDLNEEVIITEEEYAKLMGLNVPKQKHRRNSDPSSGNSGSPHRSPLQKAAFAVTDPLPLAIPNTIGIVNGTISPETIDAVNRTTRHHEEMHRSLFDHRTKAETHSTDMSEYNDTPLPKRKKGIAKKRKDLMRKKARSPNVRDVPKSPSTYNGRKRLYNIGRTRKRTKSNEQQSDMKLSSLRRTKANKRKNKTFKKITPASYADK